MSGRSRKRNANGVADSLTKQNSKSRRRLDGSLKLGPGLGHAQVQRPVAALCEHPVCLDHDDGVVVFDRNLEVVEVVLFKKARFPHGTFNESFCRSFTVLLQKARFERSSIDTDANGHVGSFRGSSNLADLVIKLANVARVDPNSPNSRVDSRKDVTRLEVNVGDHRELALCRDDVQNVGVILVRHSNANNVAPRCRELGNLLQSGIDIRRLSSRHRLNAHLRLATDPDLSDLNLSGLAAWGESLGDFGQTKINCGHTIILRCPTEQSLGTNAEQLQNAFQLQDARRL